MAETEKEKDEWLFKQCFKWAADKDVPTGLRVLSPFLGISMLIVEPIARAGFWWHEKHEKD